MQIESSITIRDLLWEWSRAYPERAGDSVSWPRMSAFGPNMVADQYPEPHPPPIDYEQAEKTDGAVLAYLNAIKRRNDRARAELEGLVFWLRYFYRWEIQHVARKVGRSKPWVEKMCQIVESTVEAMYLDKIA